jgi:K+-transporting ATPase c subunit
MAEALGIDGGEMRIVRAIARQAGVPAEAVLMQAKQIADETGISIENVLQIIAQSSQQQMDVGGMYA